MTSELSRPCSSRCGKKHSKSLGGATPTEIFRDVAKRIRSEVFMN